MTRAFYGIVATVGVLCAVVALAGPPSYTGGGGSGSVATDTIWDANGDLAQGSGANTASKLTIGTTGQILHSNGSLAYWKTPGVVGVDNIWDARGDLVQGSGSDTASKLAIGSAGQSLHSNGSLAYWDTDAGAVATDTIWDASGDLAQGTGSNTAAKLAIGAANTALHSNGSLAYWTTETYAAPGTSGNIMKSDGTNWTSSNSLSIATLDMGSSTSSIPVTVSAGQHANGSINGLMHWDSSTEVLTIGDGESANPIWHTSWTGVGLTDDGDGAITMVGMSSGYDEDLTLNFDDTENTVKFSSSTGVTTLDFSGLALVSTGAISGAVKTSFHTDGSFTLAAADVMGGMHLNGSGAAGTMTVNLPAATAGMSACFASHTSGSIIINPNGSEYFHWNGSNQAAGATIVSSGTGDNFLCLLCGTAGVWRSMGYAGTWTITP